MTYSEALLDSVSEIMRHPTLKNLTEEQQMSMMDTLQGELIGVVANTIDSKLNPEQQQEHLQILRSQGPDAANSYKRRTIPEYDQVLIDVITNYKKDYLMKLNAKA